MATASAWLRYYGTLDLPVEVVRDDETGYAEAQRTPLGVVAALTPWNFPITPAMWKIAPALRSGNTVVVTPSPYTPLTTLAMVQVLGAVLPAGVLSCVSGPDPLGATLVSHPAVRKISLTGSTATGKQVAAAAAPDLKRITLELGGNDPTIVLLDVNVPEIALSLFWAAFANNGQRWPAAKRVYAHESVHDELVRGSGRDRRDVKVDDGMVPDAMLGPVNNRPQFDRIDHLVRRPLTRMPRWQRVVTPSTGPATSSRRPSCLDLRTAWLSSTRSSSARRSR